MAIIDDIKRGYREASMLMRLIYINIGVLVVVRAAALVGLMIGADGNLWLQWLELPSAPQLLVRRLWTVVTYMFTHYDVLHILFNMLWLYWLGRIFMEYFSSKQLVGLYLLGGWGGAALYVLLYNLLPAFNGQQGYLLGASAAVIAIVVATAVYAPDYKIGLLFLGEVSLKWVALVTIAIDLLGIDSGNAGGHIAHLGGALVGLAFAWRMRQGSDITRPLNAAIDGLYSSIKGLFAHRPTIGRPIEGEALHEPETTSNATATNPTGINEAELDAILDKIKASGYSALTDEEREKLFNASRHRTVD